LTIEKDKDMDALVKEARKVCHNLEVKLKAVELETTTDRSNHKKIKEDVNQENIDKLKSKIIFYNKEIASLVIKRKQDFD